MTTDARNVIEKADVEVNDLLDGGKLNPTQSNEFFRSVIEESIFLNQIRSIQMPSDKYNIDKINFGTRMWRAAPNTGTPIPSEDRYSPTFDQIQLDVKEIISEFHIPYDVLEDNIEKGTLQQTFMQMAANRTAADFEELVLLSDTTSDDPYLSLFNGALALPDHVVDGSGITAISKTLWKTALQELPSKYLRNLADMGFYLSPHNVIEYRDKLADRGTDLGDINYEGRPSLFGFGVPIRQSHFMPSNKMLFTNPGNVIMGIHRDVLIETDRDIRRRELVVVMTARVDVKMEEPDAAVVVNNISV